MALSKRMKSVHEKIERKSYPIDDALTLLQSVSKVKFPESVDVCINLGIDARKSDQVVRGASVLPHGTGKTVRVAVFTQGENATKAKAAGADVVGMADLAEQVKAGELNFDVVIASPDAMGVVGQLGTILGPKGLMPNPKVGTVAADVADAVRKAKGGQVRYRNDKGGILHCTIGKIGFTPSQLKENLQALLQDLKKLKPSSAKGVFLQKIVVTSTMGPGLVVDPSSLDV